MIRPRLFVGAGALLGMLASWYTWRAAEAAIAAGETPAGVGFRVSHVLFVLCLPWSVPVVVVMAGVAMVTGADGPAFIAPWFYGMPVAAGVGWAAMLGRAFSRRSRRSSTTRVSSRDDG